MDKCNLGLVNPESMHPAVLSTEYDLRCGCRGLPCHVLVSELKLPYLQFSALLIFADHCLEQITSLVATFAVCLLC